jgi:UPF0755 protein
MTIKKKHKKLLKTNNKAIKYIGLTLSVVFLYFVYILFAPNFSPKTQGKAFICIPDSSSFNVVISLLKSESKISNMSSFRQVSGLMHFGTRIHSGRYEIKPGMTNFELVRILRSGRQTPVELTFNNIRTKEELAGRLSKQLMADSLSIINLLNDTAFLAKYGLNPNTAISLFIPNTYEVFWNLDSKKLFERMNKEYTAFWTNERKAKAAAIPLSPTEVSTLASIVEEETNNKTDRPKVAGLYINRLKLNMPLQADPTLKFAVGDFSLKRLMLKQILFISPYNTYRNHGLPPGPIRVASESGIDAVLNYTHHNYIYMCASETFNGEHKFASTWAEHQANAKKYQQKLNSLNIH